MSAHTPTPWRVVPHNSTIAIHGGPTDVKVAVVPKSIIEHLNGRAIADAAHIVQCVNERDGLINALRELRGAHPLPDDLRRVGDWVIQAHDLADAALKQAGE